MLHTPTVRKHLFATLRSTQHLSIDRVSSSRASRREYLLAHALNTFLIDAPFYASLMTRFAIAAGLQHAKKNGSRAPYASKATDRSTTIGLTGGHLATRSWS